MKEINISKVVNEAESLSCIHCGGIAFMLRWETESIFHLECLTCGNVVGDANIKLKLPNLQEMKEMVLWAQVAEVSQVSAGGCPKCHSPNIQVLAIRSDKKAFGYICKDCHNSFESVDGITA
jgi:hypothetical protein